MCKDSYLIKKVQLSHWELPLLPPKREAHLGAHALLMVSWYHPLGYAKQIITNILLIIIIIGGFYPVFTMYRQLCYALYISLSPHNP